MKKEIKQRIVGAIIFVIFISIMVPPILDGNISENQNNEVLVSSNKFNEETRKVIEIDLRERSVAFDASNNRQKSYIDMLRQYINTFQNNEVKQQKEIQGSDLGEDERASVIFDELENASWIIQVGSYMEL